MSTALLLILAAAQVQDGQATDPARAAWRKLQDRFGNAESVAFRAQGEVLSTSARHAGRTVAQIDAQVQVARPGFGTVDVTIQAGQGQQAEPIRVSSLGTAEGVFSVDCAQNVAYSCGAEWSASGELDDFVFLGGNWSGFCAREGDPDVVSFLPAHAEHPGLTGLRVRWNGENGRALRSAIYWLDQRGEVNSADIRIDTETVLHWNFSNFSAVQQCDEKVFVAALPAGCARGQAEAVGAAAVETASAGPVAEAVEATIEN
jgi:hypothetical protein